MPSLHRTRETPGTSRFDRRLLAPMVLGSVLNPVNSSIIAVSLVPIGRDTSRTFPPDFAELVEELGPHETDHLVTKRTWGAFTGTPLEAHLRSRGATQVVVTGVATGAGVESTARFAHELGFHVVLVLDAMTDRSASRHDRAVIDVFPAIDETTTTAELLAALAGRPEPTEPEPAEPEREQAGGPSPA